MPSTSSGSHSYPFLRIPQQVNPCLIHSYNNPSISNHPSPHGRSIPRPTLPRPQRHPRKRKSTMPHLHVRLRHHTLRQRDNRPLQPHHGLRVHLDLAFTKRWCKRKQHLSHMPPRAIPHPTSTNVALAGRACENPHGAFGAMCRFVCAVGSEFGYHAYG